MSFSKFSLSLIESLTLNAADNRHSRNTYIMEENYTKVYKRTISKLQHKVNNVMLASENIFRCDAK